MISGLCPAEIILIARNVVFSEIITGLDLDEHQVLSPDILDPVPVSPADIDRLALAYFHYRIIAGEQGTAVHHEPVLSPLRVALQAQTLPREDGNAFHFMIAGINKVFEITPGAF